MRKIILIGLCIIMLIGCNKEVNIEDQNAEKCSDICEEYGYNHSALMIIGDSDYNCVCGDSYDEVMFPKFETDYVETDVTNCTIYAT